MRYAAGGYGHVRHRLAAHVRNLCLPGFKASNPHTQPRAMPECDVMYDEALAMADQLRAASDRAQSVVYPGTTHSFLEAVSVARSADRAFAEASGWPRDMLA